MLKTKLTEIIDDFFAIGGNHDLEKYKEIRKKLLDFIRDEELFLNADDPNYILAIDTIRFIDASSIYAETTNNKKAYPHVKSFFKRLMDSQLDDWHYYELKFLISSIHLTESIEQSKELSSKAEQRIFQFKRVRRTDTLEGYLALNMCSRILNAKYFDDNIKICLDSTFQYWFNKLEYLVEKNKDLEFIHLVTRIRQDIFNGDDSKIWALCDNLENQYNEKIGEAVRNEVEFYIEAGVFEAEEIKEEYEENLAVGGEG